MGKQDAKLLQAKTRNRKLRDENKRLLIENDHSYDSEHQFQLRFPERGTSGG